jgi:hypothetical protein
MVGGRGTGVEKRQAGFLRRHRWLPWLAGGLLLVLVALGVAISVMLRRAEPMLRAAIIEKLEEHFHARVELDSFHLSLANGLTAEGKGLRIWPPAQVVGVTVPGTNKTGADRNVASNSPGPLIQLDEFRFHAPLHYKRGEPSRISVVELKGLDVDVPPKTHFTHAPTEGGSSRGAGSGSGSGFSLLNTGAALLRVEVDGIECKGAKLTLETSKPGKLPLEFDIAHIKLTDVSAGGPMHFNAELTNARPPGKIVTSGSVGPWVVEDPGETPVAGEYRFERADLSVFKGIAGILSSTGKYQGALRDLAVDGRTDTPDFRLTHFGTALPLDTVFHAHVDGTSGDTYLQPVEATLGQSHFTAEGKIVRVPGGALPDGTALPGGHEIALNVNVNRGRIEDFLRLTSKSGTPLLTGTLVLKTTLEIPPGTAPVHERILLKGNFSLEDAAFTSAKIQDDIGQLSLRGQGDAKDARRGAGMEVRSALQGDFSMAGGVITLPDLKYMVPGAEIDMRGAYGVNESTLSFKGTAKTQATVSQLVGGWKGKLLTPVDRLFKKDGAGTELPIHIEGTTDNPKFGIDFDPMKKTSPEQPGNEMESP